MPSFLDLPFDVLSMLVSLLPANDACAISNTCQQIRSNTTIIFVASDQGTLPLLFAASEVHDIRLAMVELRTDSRCVNNAIPDSLCQVPLIAGESALQLAVAQRYPLHFAVAKRDPKIVVFLLASGADRYATNREGRTALLVAVSLETAVGVDDLGVQLRVVKMLINHTPNDLADERSLVDATNALFHTAAHGSSEVLSAILDSGVDVNTCDSEGRTALCFAHDHHVTSCLLKRGAAVDVVDSKGKTVLHHATLNAYDESHKVVDILLRRPGVVINQRDHAGKTARQYASENGGRTRRRGENIVMSPKEKIECVFACRDMRRMDLEF